MYMHIMQEIIWWEVIYIIMSIYDVFYFHIIVTVYSTVYDIQC